MTVMKFQRFRLLGTYEFIPESTKLEGTFRVEVFVNDDAPTLYRCRERIGVRP